MDNDRDRILSNLETISSACNTIELYYDSIQEAIELLQEHKEIVHCYECKNRDTNNCPCYSTYINDDWYCADGERW